MTFLYEKGRKNKLYRRYLQMSMNYYTSFIFYYLVGNGPLNINPTIIVTAVPALSASIYLCS